MGQAISIALMRKLPATAITMLLFGALLALTGCHRPAQRKENSVTRQYQLR
jgi:hypothetical protein